jgi:ATP-dependent protease HslVU (ClpYQ) peptidase subunit
MDVCLVAAVLERVRAAVELAKVWRQDRILRHLEVCGELLFSLPGCSVKSLCTFQVFITRVRIAMFARATCRLPLQCSQATMFVADATTCLEVSGRGKLLWTASCC